VPIKRAARLLAQRGHEPVLAVQDVATLGSSDFPVWQAPLSPRLLASGARKYPRTPTTMGDIMARLGCDDPAIVAALVRAWRLLLDELRPDLVIGEFAPFLLCAARGWVPTVGFGQAFSTPPAHLAAFPILDGSAPLADEQATLAATNEGLAAAGAAALPALPGLFAADEQVVGTFEELDHYRGRRRHALAPPALPQDVEGAAGAGDEVFVYMQEVVGPDAPLWEGLARSKLPIRVHQPRAPAASVQRFASFGFRYQSDPVPFDVIARRSRLLLSHGGVGTVSGGLLAGLPQVVCFFDLEKRLNGHSVAALGIGGHVHLPSIEPDAFAASLVRLYADEVVAARARDIAPSFRARMNPPLEAILADRVEALLPR